jgi:hypothetical protein
VANRTVGGPAGPGQTTGATMYVGLGTVVLVLAIILIVMMMRRRA